MPFPQRLCCKVIEPLEPTTMLLFLLLLFNGMSSQPSHRHSLFMRIPYGLSIHQRSEAFHPLCQTDLLNVSIDLHYCSHRGHDSNETLFFSVLTGNMHTCVQHLYMCPSICYFSRLKQLLLSEPVLTLFCHSSMSAAVSLKRIAEAESLRYNNETNAKRENWWKEWIKEMFCESQTRFGCRCHAQHILDEGVFSLVIKLFPC